MDVFIIENCDRVHYSGVYLLSRVAVPSVVEDLTSVFEMRTGVTPPAKHRNGAHDHITIQISKIFSLSMITVTRNN